jgi:hypothetical protein
MDVPILSIHLGKEALGDVESHLFPFFSTAGPHSIG